MFRTSAETVVAQYTMLVSDDSDHRQFSPRQYSVPDIKSVLQFAKHRPLVHDTMIGHTDVVSDNALTDMTV